MKSLRDKFDSSIPTVVHCSAGVGRSGVLVLSDMLTEAHDSGEVKRYRESVWEKRDRGNWVKLCLEIMVK